MADDCINLFIFLLQTITMKMVTSMWDWWIKQWLVIWTLSFKLYTWLRNLEMLFTGINYSFLTLQFYAHRIYLAGGSVGMLMRNQKTFRFNCRNCFCYYRQAKRPHWKRRIWLLVLDGKAVMHMTSMVNATHIFTGLV